MCINKNIHKFLAIPLTFSMLLGHIGIARPAQAYTPKIETEPNPSSPQCTPYSIDQDPAGANEPEDLFGAALAVGDFNGDGIDDLAVGAPGEEYDDSGPDAGVVFIYSGSPDQLGEPYFIHQEPLGSNESGDRFGSSLAEGDFNGDGIADLAVGVPGEDYQESGPDAGVVFVFTGSPDGLAVAALIHQNPHGDNEGGDLFGTALAAGDFNGDGIDDLAISAMEAAFEDFGANVGWIYIANGSPEGLGDSYFIDQNPAGANEAEDRFGSSLAVGDFNADGIDDLAVGAPGEDFQDSGPDAGVVFVFSGGTNGLEQPYTVDQDPHGANEAGDLFGTALAAGDLNGDGTDDIAIGVMEQAFEDYGANAGWIYIANGSSDGLGDSSFIDQTPAGANEAEDKFGASLAVGDFNSDGIADLAAGAPGEDYDGSGPGAGVAFVFTGSSEGVGDPYFIHQEPFGSNESGDHFGAALAAGDFNGDGLDELAIGAPNETYEDVGTNVGWVLITCSDDDKASIDKVEESQPQAGYSILFEEDFEVEFAGWGDWDQTKTPQAARSIENGAYKLLAIEPHTKVWGGHPSLNDIADFTLDVDMSMLSDSKESVYGVEIRYIDEDNYTTFILSAKQYFFFGSKIKGEWIIYNRWDGSGYINAGKATNHITVEALGSNISVYVNDELLSQTENAPIIKGEIKPYMQAAEEEANVPVAVDNIVVLVSESDISIQMGTNQIESRIEYPKGFTIVFEENYDANSGNENDWIQTETDKYIKMITDGAYHFKTLTGNGLAGTHPNFEDRENFFLDFDAYLLEDFSQSQYGIKFRSSGNNYYLFLIKANGEFYFSKMVDREKTTIIDWEKSTFIKPGMAINHFTIVADGIDVAIYINGELLAQHQEPKLESGDIWLTLIPPKDQDMVTVAWDNIILATP